MTQFGSSTFGDTPFGSPEQFDTVANTLNDVQPVHHLSRDEPLADLLRTFGALSDDLSGRIESVYWQRYAATATREQLDLLAEVVNVDQQTDEPDAAFRRRVQAAYLAALSRGTYEDIAKVAMKLLDTSPDKVTVRRARNTADPATCVVETSSAVIDDAPFTQGEMQEIIGRAAVGGHRVILRQSDVFTWGDPDNGWGTDWGKSVQ